MEADRKWAGWRQIESERWERKFGIYDVPELLICFAKRKISFDILKLWETFVPVMSRLCVFLKQSAVTSSQRLRDWILYLTPSFRNLWTPCVRLCVCLCTANLWHHWWPDRPETEHIRSMGALYFYTQNVSHWPLIAPTAGRRLPKYFFLCVKQIGNHSPHSH